MLKIAFVFLLVSITFIVLGTTVFKDQMGVLWLIVPFSFVAGIFFLPDAFRSNEPHEYLLEQKTSDEERVIAEPTEFDLGCDEPDL